MTASVGHQASLTSWASSELLVANLTATSISITDSAAIGDATGLGQSGASFATLLRSATGSFSARWKGGGTPKTGAAGALAFDPTYYGVSDGDPPIGFTDFSLNLSWGALEISSSTDATFDTTFRAGILSWSGSINLRLDDTEPLTQSQISGNAVIEATFNLDATHTFVGNIWITGTSKTASINTTSAQSFSFQGTGALTAAGANNLFAAGAIPIVTPRVLVATYATGRTVSASAFPSSVSITVPRNEMINVDVGVQYTGALTLA